MASTRNILEGIQILLPYYNNQDGHHTAAEHDVLYMYPTDKPVSEEDGVKLAKLNWRESSDGWEIYT